MCSLDQCTLIFCVIEYSWLDNVTKLVERSSEEVRFSYIQDVIGIMNDPKNLVKILKMVCESVCVYDNVIHVYQIVRLSEAWEEDFERTLELF